MPAPRYVTKKVPVDVQEMLKNISVKRFREKRQKTSPLIMLREKSGGELYPVLLTAVQAKKVDSWMQTGAKRAMIKLSAAQLDKMIKGDGLFKDISSFFLNIGKDIVDELLPGNLGTLAAKPLQSAIDKADAAILKSIDKKKSKKKKGKGCDACGSDSDDDLRRRVERLELMLKKS